MNSLTQTSQSSYTNSYSNQIFRFLDLTKTQFHIKICLIHPTATVCQHEKDLKVCAFVSLQNRAGMLTYANFCNIPETGLEINEDKSSLLLSDITFASIVIISILRVLLIISTVLVVLSVSSLLSLSLLIFILQSFDDNVKQKAFSKKSFFKPKNQNSIIIRKWKEYVKM